ncbi:MAG: DUF1585 domain-containing protein [Deltaproteobacteria bacterium]|nr:DUF1585 domain-containing protein [Deltaproteobacteria bacterium]
MRTFAVLLLCAAACGTDHAPPPPDAGPAADPTLHYLSPTEHLTRASLALRGVRPSVADLKAVAADPSQLPAIVDRYLGSPEFGATIEDLHNEQLLMRLEQPQFTMQPIAGTATEGATFLQLNQSVYEEPLQLIRDVVMSDRPYTDIVTADYTIADGLVAAIWGYPHQTAVDQWEKTMYPDGRGAAGILATSAFYERWHSTGFNYNRGRANEISRALLCHDFLTSDIMVDTSIDLSNPDVVANAVVQNPSCAGCHQTLDPLASYLFPFKGNLVVGQITAYPLPWFAPGQINRWQTTNKRPPMYFGDTASGLTGLGQAIANDPRFARCAAVHFASYFTEVPEDQLPAEWIAQLQHDFVASNYSAKLLAKAVVLSDAFRVSHDTDATKAEGVVGYLKTRPEQMSRMLTDLTGYHWQATSNAQVRGMRVGTGDLLQGDFVGFRVLAGGIDNYFVTQPVFTMNATSSLVARTAAAAAADYVVEHDATAAANARTLFTQAAVGATDETSVRKELVFLHARIFGELDAPGDPAIDDAYQLFTDALAASGDAKRAWKLTLTGMLGDFRALFY